MVALATWKIIASHAVLSHTVDEPTHVAGGLEWLENGTQRLHAENPPLGRIGAGLGAYLAGHRLPAAGTAPQRGTDVLYADGDYGRSLGIARWGTLPFFLLMSLLVWLWTDQLAGTRAALLATLATVSLPPLLGHAALATTDIPFVAMFLLALWSFVSWLDSPTLSRALLLGLALGLATATKFSTLIFFPPSALIILVATRGSDTAVTLARTAARVALGTVLLLLVTMLTVWGAYRFSLGSIVEIQGAERVIEVGFPDTSSLGRRIVDAIADRPMPAPDALFGLLFLKAHAVQGHSAYLFGRQSDHGFWYFYPVALAVKTPITFLALLGLSFAGLLRRPAQAGWRAMAPAAAALAILAVSMLSTVNIGLRHVLIVYPLLAITLGVGLDSLVQSHEGPWRRLPLVGVGLLLAWQVATILLLHPNYLGYFNPLAGPEPGRVLVDSDLDWGQDALQLQDTLRERDIDLLNIAFFGSVRLCELDLPPLRHLPPGQPVSGWVAISEMYFRGHWHLDYPDVCDRTRARKAAEGLSYDWLRDHQPVATAGRSIRLYHLPDD